MICGCSIHSSDDASFLAASFWMVFCFETLIFRPLGGHREPCPSDSWQTPLTCCARRSKKSVMLPQRARKHLLEQLWTRESIVMIDGHPFLTISLCCSGSFVRFPNADRMPWGSCRLTEYTYWKIIWTESCFKFYQRMAGKCITSITEPTSVPANSSNTTVSGLLVPYENNHVVTMYPVIRTSSAYICKHIIASRLAEACNKIQERFQSHEDLCKIFSTLFEDEKFRAVPEELRTKNWVDQLNTTCVSVNLDESVAGTSGAGGSLVEGDMVYMDRSIDEMFELGLSNRVFVPSTAATSTPLPTPCTSRAWLFDTF